MANNRGEGHHSTVMVDFDDGKIEITINCDKCGEIKFPAAAQSHMWTLYRVLGDIIAKEGWQDTGKTEATMESHQKPSENFLKGALERFKASRGQKGQ